ncbi:HEAT repeat-containing protein 1 isoform X2 [Cimex lectularius]|uniref:HEAT repeat-containing protein 1 n=1 Tax=Cimex lectularius TaxID=79782 RepID=A0A8I6RX38_CIMLE|nr:HEAT repeat-containing protein 1 isoform X2 [Cimex lectularius]
MPITSLAAQLKRLEAPQTNLLIHKKKKASFLFDSKEAARLDRDTFYEIGISGLEELKALNPNFASFETTLFDVTSKGFERSMETQETNEKLNYHIRNFLVLLSPYFLIKSSHKAIEWLINRYHIHEFNVDDIMFLILPYHETMQFARMLQLIPIQEQVGTWHWLYNVKREGVPLSKIALLNRTAKDMSFLKFVANMPIDAIKIHGNKAHSLATLYGFYCTTVIGGLEYSETITEIHISHLLPSLMAGLSSTVPDFTASTYMIIASLSTKACLGEKILHGLFNKICKVEHKKLYSETTLILVLLCQSSLKKVSLPEAALKKLASTDWLLSSLTTLSKQNILIIPFVVCLLRSAIKLVIQGGEELKPFVQSLLNQLQLDNSDAQEIFNCLLEEFNEECEESILCWYSTLVRELEKSFPNVFDVTASRALSAKGSKGAVALETLLGVNISRNDLYEKLVHTNEDVRVSAIKHITKHLEPEQLGWLRQSLLERFKDDSYRVVKMLLSMPQPLINSLSPEGLFENLIVVISKFSFHLVILKNAISMLMSMVTPENLSAFVLAALPEILPIIKHKVLKDIDIPEFCSFFSTIKRSDEEADPGKIVWSVLAREGVLPPIDNIFTAFEKSLLFTNNSRYWFAMSLMVANSIPAKPDPTRVKKIVNFLLDYLKCHKMCVENDGELLNENTICQCLNKSKERLPVEGALYALTVLTSKTLNTQKHLKSPWFDFNSKGNIFTLFVYKVIHEGIQSQKKQIKKAFSKTQIIFLKNHFPNVETQINFLLNALIYDSSLGQKCISLIEDIIRNDESLLSTLIKQDSAVVPALMMLLGSKDEPVRTGVINIIQIITGSLANEFYRPLLDELAAFAIELKLDHEQIVIFAYSHLSPVKEISSMLSTSKRESFRQVLTTLLSTITSVSTPMYIKAKLLQILEFVQSEELFYELLPLAMELLNETKTLSEVESTVLSFILKRFNPQIINCVNEPKIWDFLAKGFSDHRMQMDDSEAGKKICPAAVLMNQISRDLFENMPEPKMENQEKLLCLIITNITDSENAQVISACASLFKRIAIDCKILVSLLYPMITVQAPLLAEKKGLRPRLRKSIAAIPSLEILESLEWKKGVCLLEMTQNKKKLTSINLLLPVLFNILKKCLQFEEQGPVEYNKQLVLSSILHCCERLTEKSENIVLSQETLHVDLVVDCLRASHNPQTHHHALLTLTYIAHLIPEQVLHNIMAIFTFIGSSVLRQDDAYSFQIIAKVIDTIIPVLIKTSSHQELELSVCNVIRVFVAALLDVPEHRRIPVMRKLMVTLEDGKYLWIFLLLVFESQVLRPTTQSTELSNFGLQENTVLPKKLDIALQICGEFPPPVILLTCHKLLLHVSALPNNKDDKNVQKVKDNLILSIFNVNDNTGKQLRHYKYTLVMFMSYLLSSNTFVLQIAELAEDESESLEGLFEVILEQNLIYIRSVLKQVELSSGQPTAKYWKAVLNQTYDILDKINALLPTAMFLRVVKSLMNNELEAIRRKAIELLGWRLQQPRPVPTEVLIGLLKPLRLCLDTISPQEVSQDVQLTQQTALLAMKLMARHLAHIYKDEFKMVLVKLSGIISLEFPPNWALIGSLVLCIGELTTALKAHSLFQLQVFMPAIIKQLQNHRKEEGNELLLLSIVTSVQKIVDCLVLFISPYIDSLLYELSLLSAKFSGEQQESPKSHLVQKLKMIRQKLSSETPNRVLVPAVSTCFTKLIKHNAFSGVSPLMSILSESITSSSDLTVEMTNFFLTALQFRANFPELPLDQIESVETPVISSLTVMVLKLSEAAFRPLYHKLYDWAVRNTDQTERAITFYRLSGKIAESLKNLFNLFAGIFVANCSELLEQIISSKQKEECYAVFEGEFGEEKTCLLLDCILKTLLTIFTYDSQNFITKERFNNLVHPLVNQLENEVGGVEMWKERCEKLLTPCIAQMSTSTSDDSLWKQLNNQVLLKTRHEKSHVRLAALRTICKLAEKLGEDFLPLLPETVPCLAELLEDDEEEVEKECQRVVNEMEVILGEPIQKYF